MDENLRTIGEVIEHQARRWGEKTFLFFRDRKVSYADLDRITNQAASGFRNIGVRPNDKVCLMMSNRPEFIFCWLALNKIGAVMVPVNTAFRGEELSYIVNHAEAGAVVTEEPFLPAFQDLGLEKGTRRIVHIGDQEAGNVLPYHKFLGDPSDTPTPVPVSERTHAVYPYTSGTTGRPKGVMLTHRTYVQTGRSFAMAVGIKPQDRIMTPNPLFHVNAMCYSTMGALVSGAGLVLLERFSASGMARDVARYEPTILVLVLASATILYHKYREGPDWRTSLRRIVAGGVPKGEYRNFEKKFGVKLQNLYSMTETPMGIMSPRDDPARDGGIGFPMPVPEGYGENIVRVTDGLGHDVGPGEVGDIIVKNSALMEGYFKDPLATEQALLDGFLHTGDKARQDEDGYVYFLGRGRDVLRKKGHNISSAEVEGVLNIHPSVLETAVVGIPSDYGDDEIKAFVVFRANQGVDWKDLQDWCGERLAGYKIPQVFQALDALPKNAMGRIMKTRLGDC